MFSAPMKTGGENVTEEVNVQTPLITSILESLVGKAQGANITPETVLKGYKGYRGQELIEGTYEPQEPAGSYVWKRGIKTDITPTSSTKSGAYILTVVPDSSNMTEADFDGAVVSILKDGASFGTITLTYSNGSGTGNGIMSATYTFSDGTLSIGSQTVSYYNLTVDKIYIPINYLDYRVSNNENEYPNESIHTDGYYYEKIKELSGLLRMSMFITKVTFSSNTNMNTIIPHTLGKVPEITLIFANTTPTDTRCLEFACILNNSKYILNRTKQNSIGNSYTESSSLPTATQIFTSWTDVYYQAGIEYTILAFA